MCVCLCVPSRLLFTLCVVLFVSLYPPPLFLFLVAMIFLFRIAFNAPTLGISFRRATRLCESTDPKPKKRGARRAHLTIPIASIRFHSMFCVEVAFGTRTILVLGRPTDDDKIKWEHFRSITQRCPNDKQTQKHPLHGQIKLNAGVRFLGCLASHFQENQPCPVRFSTSIIVQRLDFRVILLYRSLLLETIAEDTEMNQKQRSHSVFSVFILGE